MNKSRDFFVRVLVDIDIIYALPQILVERIGFTFIANIEFEKLPTFLLMQNKRA